MQRPAIGLDAVCLDLHLNNTHVQDTNTAELYPRRRTQSKVRPGWLHGDTGHGPAVTAEDLLGNSRPHSSRLLRRCQQPQAACRVPVRLQAASQGGSGTRCGGHREAPLAPAPTKWPRTGDQGVPQQPEWRTQRHPPRRTADTLRLPPPGLCLRWVTCAIGRRWTTQTTSDEPPRPRARGPPERRPADASQGAKASCGPWRGSKACPSPRPGKARLQPGTGDRKACSQRGAAEPRSQARVSPCRGGAGSTALTEHGPRAESRAPGRVGPLGGPAHRPPRDRGRTKRQRAPLAQHPAASTTWQPQPRAGRKEGRRGARADENREGGTRARGWAGRRGAEA